MKRQPWDGRNSVRAVLLLWLGFTAGSSAATAVTRPVAARATALDYDELVAELHTDIINGLEKRLAFEAWADSR